MDLFPAIDLREGRAVRLYQGDYDRMAVYKPDPAASKARAWAAGPGVQTVMRCACIKAITIR